VVETVSETLTSAYETYVQPVLGSIVTPAAAQMTRTLNPQRAQRWAVSDLNPFLWPLKGMADMARANRAARDSDGPAVMMERWMAAVTSASWDLYRDLRDAAVENTFFRLYSPASIGKAAEETGPAEEPFDARDAPRVKAALLRIDTGDWTSAVVRAVLLLMKAGTGRRRLSAMRRARELVGKEIGLLDMSAEVAREIIREQSYIVDFEPEKALAALPKLLPTAADRHMLLDLLHRLEGRIEANPKQVALKAEIRRLVTDHQTAGKAKSEPITVLSSDVRAETRRPAAKRRPSSHPRDHRRTRATS